jgi:hypothetical protein
MAICFAPESECFHAGRWCCVGVGRRPRLSPARSLSYPGEARPRRGGGCILGRAPPAVPGARRRLKLPASVCHSVHSVRLGRSVSCVEAGMRFAVLRLLVNTRCPSRAGNALLDKAEAASPGVLRMVMAFFMHLAGSAGCTWPAPSPPPRSVCQREERQGRTDLDRMPACQREERKDQTGLGRQEARVPWPAAAAALGPLSRGNDWVRCFHVEPVFGAGRHPEKQAWRSLVGCVEATPKPGQPLMDDF